MKIAIFSDSFYPQTNGVVSYLTNTSNLLAERGHKISLFVPKSSKRVLRSTLHKNISIHYVRGIPAFFYPDFKLTNIISLNDIKIMKKTDPDIVYLQTPFTMGLKAIVLSKLMKKPLAGIFHTHIASEGYLSVLGKISERIDLEKFGWIYLRFFYNKCDMIISPSHYIAKDLRNNSIKAPVFVVNNYIKEQEFSERPSKMIIPPNSFVFFGRISAEKNIHKLIDAFKIVAKKKDAYLYIIGEGPGLQDTKRYVSSLRLGKRIIITGFMENNLLIKTDLLHKFKAFVTMSNTEVQPISILESMAKGLPIIGPRARGVTELVTTNGILVRRDSVKGMARAMQRILGSECQRNKMSSESSKILLAHYNSKKSIDRLEKLFLELIRKSGD